MSLRLRELPATGYRRTRWKNGGGWTTEIAVEPADSDVGSGFDWRVSIAEIEQDGPFSPFPGVERDLFLLDGNGMDLLVDDREVRMDQPLQRIHFSGDSAVDCRLIDGPTRDFNVMVRARTTVAYIAGTTSSNATVVAGPAGSQWLIHQIDGQSVLAIEGVETRLGAGDSVQLDSPDAPGEFGIASDGKLILVRFSPRTATD